jgi:hypothetical protein
MKINKNLLFIIFIIFIFNFNILWHIIKSLLYIVISLFILNYIDSNLTLQIKEILIDIINMGSNSNFIKDIFNNIRNSIPYKTIQKNNDNDNDNDNDYKHNNKDAKNLNNYTNKILFN